MKHSQSLLRSRLDDLVGRAISPLDGPGYIYHFFDSRFQVKVGRSVNVAHRRAQWDHACWNRNRKWKPPVWCSYAHRAGKFRSNLYQSVLTRNRIDYPYTFGDGVC